MADLKATLCGELPQNAFSPQTEQLIALLERRGIVEDPSIVNEKARHAEQALRRNMYHNTQMMLKHYRDIVWALECFPEQVAEELDRPLKDLDALLSMVDTQLAIERPITLDSKVFDIRLPHGSLRCLQQQGQQGKYFLPLLFLQRVQEGIERRRPIIGSCDP